MQWVQVTFAISRVPAIAVTQRVHIYYYYEIRPQKTMFWGPIP